MFFDWVSTFLANELPSMGTHPASNAHPKRRLFKLPYPVALHAAAVVRTTCCFAPRSPVVPAAGPRLLMGDLWRQHRWCNYAKTFKLFKSNICIVVYLFLLSWSKTQLPERRVPLCFVFGFPFVWVTSYWFRIGLFIDNSPMQVHKTMTQGLCRSSELFLISALGRCLSWTAAASCALFSFPWKQSLYITYSSGWQTEYINWCPMIWDTHLTTD